VPRSRILEQGAYEFFAGFDAKGEPLWSSNAANRKPVFEDPDGVGWNVSVSYNAGLRRYLLCTEHTKSFEGRMGLFESPRPWGPWKTVYYARGSDVFGRGHVETTTFYWNFSNKWLSENGEKFVLVFTGINSNDSWNTVEGAFELAPGRSRFIRGNSNRDENVDIGDAVFSLGYLFTEEETPSCLESLDVNDDGKIDIADPISLLAYLFGGAPEPASPFPECGRDPTADDLGCLEFSPCL